LRQQQNRIDELNLQIQVITFDDASRAQLYSQNMHLSWPVLIDHDRRAYAAYQMQRAGLWELYNPVSIAKYLSLMIKGNRPGKPGKDWHQLGGDVLMDPQGIVRLHHVSRTPHDRPTPDQIFELIRSRSETGS